MIHTLSIQDFVRLQGSIPLLDVRTPAEYEAGHIPGAINLPLFSNEERIIIGTLYKKQGREKALLKGLELIGPRMAGLIRETEKAIPGREVILHCWRGGMRSGSMAWLLDLYGFRVSVIKGGYKQYRRWAATQFAKPLKLLVLGGYTGSGKTQVLHELARQGVQIIDLEGLAHHKGSAFGAIGEQPPPTQEQFENNLAWAISVLDTAAWVWVEDESRMIGKKVVPPALFDQMRAAALVFMQQPLERRVARLVETYGLYPREELAASIESIQKRLGGLAAKQALEALEEGRLDETARLLLYYYDKTYLHGISKREEGKIIEWQQGEMDDAETAAALRKLASKMTDAE